MVQLSAGQDCYDLACCQFIVLSGLLEKKVLNHALSVFTAGVYGVQLLQELRAVVSLRTGEHSLWASLEETVYWWPQANLH